ncbi:MAG: imidazolonepropionase, partial [Bacteroidetes bacterium]|nr:imidazolonepropionase [Bacteroidota bacterium]
MNNSLLIKNIKQLVGIDESGRLLRKGSEMAELSSIENAFIYCKDGLIEAYGKMEDISKLDIETSNVTEVDATNKTVLPSFV